MFQQDRLPSEEQQLRFCRAYAAAMLGLLREQQTAQQQAQQQQAGGGAPARCSLPAAVLGEGAATANGSGGGGGGGEEAVDSAARLLLAKARAHLPLVHIKWGLWGLIQDKVRSPGWGSGASLATPAAAVPGRHRSPAAGCC